jgi:ankyrin repeat protein
MLDRIGTKEEPGKVSCFSRGNWIRIRLSETEAKPPGADWEAWGKGRLGFLLLNLPIRAESKWLTIRKDIQRIAQASDPVPVRPGEEGLLLRLHGAIREKDEKGLVGIVEEHPELARRRLELDTNLKAGREETLLHVAAAAGMKTLAVLLLDNGADIDAFSRSGGTPLFFAVGKEDMEMVRLLLDRKADVNRTSKHGRSPLGKAAWSGNLALVRTLLDKGADPNGFSYGNPSHTPLGDALMSGKLEILTLLLDRGADPDLCISKFWSPLQYAAEKGNLEAAKLLLKRGADVNHQAEETKQTPLHQACFEGRLEIVKLLVEHGADLNVEDWRGKTPLACARDDGHADVAAFLETKGAK